MVNPVFAKLLGKKREELTSKAGQKKLLNRLAPGLFDKFVQVVETGEPLEQELGWKTDTGKKFYDLIAVKVGDGFSITVREKSGKRAARESISSYNARIVNDLTIQR